MKAIFYLTLLLVIHTLISCESKKERIIGNDQNFLVDYDIFRNIYESGNAGIYKYHSKGQVDSAFVANRNLITKESTFREYFNILWNVIDYTGSCHNSLTYPQKIDKELNAKKVFFPYPLKWLDSALYINIEKNDLVAGSKLVSINGMEAQEFANKISNYVSTDGHNKTGKLANINTDWSAFYIYLVLGEQDDFQITIQDADLGISKLTVASVDYAGFYKNFKERHSRIYEERNESDYSFQNIDSLNAGLLTISTFSLGGPQSQGHKLYKNFLDSVFLGLRKKGIDNLIVDIRGNGGGNDPNDLLLYSYLTDREFRENRSAFTIFNEVPHQKYYLDDDIEELKSELTEEHSIQKKNRFFQKEEFNKFWKPNKNAFDGNLILLIDPFVASAGSLFASMVKSDVEPIVIGEETLGGYYGHTGHIPVNYQLPYSKLVLTFSIVDLEQDVVKLVDEQYGDGVKPDIRVTQSLKDFMDQRDTQLQKAIELINQNR